MTSPWATIQQVRRLHSELGVAPVTTAVLVGASIVAGFAEAAVLTLVAQAAAAMSSGAAPVASFSVAGIDVSSISLRVLIGVAAFCAVVRLLLQLIVAYLPARITGDVQRTLRDQLFAAYEGASWEAQAAESEGDLEQIAGQQVNRGASLILSAAIAAGSAFSFVALAVSAVLVSPVGAVLAVLAAGGLFVLLRPVVMATRRRSQVFTKVTGELAYQVAERVRLAEEHYVFGSTEMARTGILETARAASSAFFRVRLLTGILAPLYQAVVICLLLFGLLIVDLRGSAQIASLGAVVLILIRALSYSQNVQSGYQAINEQAPSLRAVRGRIARFTAAKETNQGQDLPTIGAIRVDRVTFSYPGAVDVLSDVSMELRRGHAVGLVGPSGAGKSTLVQLLLRMRAPQVGRILADGVPIDNFAKDAWFRHVSYVPQESRVMTATVADNIRFLRPWITDEMIRHAARLARIDEEIRTWPNDYHAEIGQRHGAISGGQRQRLSLARAIAGGPDFIILDEPTSALDAHSEALVRDALDTLRQECGLLIVSHRLSTLRSCGQIVVLIGGRVEALGTVDELLESNPFFRRAVELSTFKPSQ